MAVVTICSDFGAQENKVCCCFHCFPIFLPWSDGTRCHHLSFLFFILLKNFFHLFLLVWGQPLYNIVVGFVIHWHESAMVLHVFPISFLMLSFKPPISLSFFTFIKRLFSSSLLSALRVVSSAYLRLLIFLQAILMPACDSSSLAFYTMYFA